MTKNAVVPALTDQHPLDRAACLVGGRDALAGMLGVSRSAIGNWKAREVPEKQCVRIECITNGRVSRRDLRPDDWQDIWPELATQEPAAIESEAGEVAHG